MAIFAGVGLGWFFPDAAQLIAPLGTVFVRLLRMIIAPLVFSSLVCAILNLTSFNQFKRLGKRTGIYYAVTTTSAILVGAGIVNSLQPGSASTFLSRLALAEHPPTFTVPFTELIHQIIPLNMVEAFASDSMLMIIFISILFGISLLKFRESASEIVQVITSLNSTMLKITDWVIRLTPWGVFSLFATQIANLGVGIIKPLIFYFITVYFGLIIYFFILTLALYLKVSPLHYLRKTFPALATAFSTTSSVATLPITMESLKQCGISKRVSSFVAPLGATINMDGTALFLVVAAYFIAQVYGIEMTVAQHVVLMLTAGLGSIGAAGIPGGGIIALMIVLRSVNIPLEGVGLIIGIDRLVDMGRTTINVYSDLCGALFVSDTVEPS